MRNLPIGLVPFLRVLEGRGSHNRRILWGAEDIIRNRPPLSRWHPDYADEFAAFLASPSPFRQG